MFIKIGKHVKKEIIKNSEYTDDELPQINEVVSIKLIMNNIIEELKFKIGKFEKYEILEQLVQTMFLDEVSIFKIDKNIFLSNIDYLYNNNNVELEIELVDYWKDEENPLDFPINERIVKSLEYKEKGTKYYKENNYEEAIINYDKALEFIELNNDSLIILEKIKLINNISLMNLKLYEYKEVINYCDYCLKYDKLNEKALYRKSLALYKLNEYEKSFKISQLILINYPNNLENNNIYNFLKNKLNLH